MKGLKLIAVGVLALGCASAAFAKGPRGGFLIGTDLEFGGDTVATVSFEDGSTQDVDAGQGISLALGGYFRPSGEVPFEINGSVGYKYVTTAANNADINISRVVLKLNGAYWFDNGWFVSAGITHHSSPKLDGDGFFENIYFDDSTGFSLEAGWRYVSLRYTNLTYTSPLFEDVDASSIGVNLTWRFGQHRGY